MENSKYYTPEIDEFHVGFEFQVFGFDAQWNKVPLKKGVIKYEEECSKQTDHQIEYGTTFYSLSWIDKIFTDDDIDSQMLRVKLLDREDIEACGFVFVEYNKEYECDIYKKVHEIFSTHIHHLTVTKYKSIRITEDDAIGRQDCRFYGEIKNISELKKIMKQLKIG